MREPETKMRQIRILFAAEQLTDRDTRRVAAKPAHDRICRFLLRSIFVRRLLLILLMIILPWQAIASTLSSLTHESDNIVMHMAEHDLGIAHHHHDDGSFHHDNSETSREHLSEHVCCPGAAMLVSLSIDVSVIFASLAPPEFSPPFLAGPVLEGLRRPPRALA